MTFRVGQSMVHKYDTERAVGLLRKYQANLTSPEEHTLRTSVGKVSAILGSQLFQALLDIQECYEVTLQQTSEESVVKEDRRQDAWEVIFQLHTIDYGENKPMIHSSLDHSCLWGPGTVLEREEVMEGCSSHSREV
ncbi:unnamed protein product [Pleuronectes platessa]|uniref:L27 domain-containing protein n=1 Tax=Pleuronectes platessa TaxID=8262 RepID=A0A9N7VZG3_PLEPL|nr:unnamed protein product [Pleuronectes platessa]